MGLVLLLTKHAFCQPQRGTFRDSAVATCLSSSQQKGCCSSDQNVCNRWFARATVLEPDVDSTPGLGNAAPSQRVYVLDDEPLALDVIRIQLATASFDVVTFSAPEPSPSQLATIPSGVVVGPRMLTGSKSTGAPRKVQTASRSSCFPEIRRRELLYRP